MIWPISTTGHPDWIWLSWAQRCARCCVVADAKSSRFIIVHCMPVLTHRMLQLVRRGVGCDVRAILEAVTQTLVPCAALSMRNGTRHISGKSAAGTDLPINGSGTGCRAFRQQSG